MPKRGDPRDVKMPKTCPDCGAPVFKNYLPIHGCWHTDQIAEAMRRDGRSEEIPSMRMSGADNPCSSHNYDWNERERVTERNGVIAAFVMVCAIVGLAIMVWNYYA